jgi:hypothetical protein
MTPGAMPQAGGECCAFGAKHIPRRGTVPLAKHSETTDSRTQCSIFPAAFMISACTTGIMSAM